MSRRFALALATLAMNAIACGLSFEPGDYTWHVPEAGTATNNEEGGTPTEEGGAVDAPGGGSHLLVLASERDVTAGSGVTTDTNDSWIADIDAKGDITHWSYAQPTPYRGRIRWWSIADGKLWVVRQSNSSSQRSLEFVPFANGVTGTWKGAAVEQDQFYQDPASLFFSNTLYSFGGGGTVQVDANAFQFQLTDTIRLRPFTAADLIFDASVQSPTKLPTTMQGMASVTYKDFVYLVGGSGGSTAQEYKVRYAKLDPTPSVGVGAFSELPDLKNPVTQQNYSVQQPSVCAHAGMLYILGGSGSDIVLGGKIDETTGAIAQWVGLTKLPGPLRDAGCAVYAGAMHLVGGYGSTSRSDRVIRAKLAADGTLGDWELSSGEPMPAARSSIAAIPY